MTLLWRFGVLFAFSLWQGGFLFYTTFVVPAGTEELGPTEQGFITRRVTVILNLVGGITLAVMACDHWNRRSWGRWVVWLLLVALQGTLFYLHPRMDALLNMDTHAVATGFYAMHRIYLWASTFLWLFAWVWFALTWWQWNRPRVGG